MTTRGSCGTSAAVAATVATSFGPIIVKDSLLSGLAFGAWRLAGAALLLHLLLRASGGTQSAAKLRRSMPSGLVFGVNAALFFTAVKSTSVANATLIASMQPIVLLYLGQRMFGERIRPWHVALTAVAIGGAAVVIIGAEGTSSGSLRGDLLAVGAMVTFSLYLAFGKHARATMGTLELQAGQMLGAAVVVVPLALVARHDLFIDDVWSYALVGLMILVPGLGHILTNYAHAHVRLLVVSLLNLGVPVGAAIWAWWLLGESVTPLQTAGMVIVLASLAAVVVFTQAPRDDGSQPAQGTAV